MKSGFFKKAAEKAKMGPSHEWGLDNNPYRDWQIIVVIFFLINLGVVFSSYYFFEGISQREIVPTTQSVSSGDVILDQKKLDGVIASFALKQLVATSSQKTSVKVIDPSL